jgi:hypothetical protein
LTQDSLDDTGRVDEADDLQRTGTTAAEHRVGFIYLSFFRRSEQRNGLHRPDASLLLAITPLVRLADYKDDRKLNTKMDVQLRVRHVIGFTGRL